MTESSPWWYRDRALVFTAIFWAGFLGGDALCSIVGRAGVPLVVWAAPAFGANGKFLLLAAATLLVFAGFAVRVWGSSYLSARVVWNPDTRLQALVVAGPFRYVRNPLYLGSALIATGVGALASPIGFAIIAIGHAIFIPMLMRHESLGLRARFGASYDDYLRSVPALVPRLTPAHVPGAASGVSALTEGFRAEILSAALAVGMIAVWVAGHYASPLFIMLWIVGAIAQRLVAPPL